MSETTHDPQGFEDAEAAERRRMAAQDEDALQADVDLDADEYWMAETDEFLLTRDEAEARRWLAIGHDVRRVRVHITDSATPPTPESGAHREVRKSVVCEKCYGLTSCWCPPTPDRAAVREGLINAIEALRVTVHRAPSEEFAMLWRNVHRAIDALLVAVSRPAEARGEPWGYACRVRYTDNVASDWWIRFRTEELPTSHQAQVIPLYTRPAPVVSEANHPIVEAAALLARYGYSVTPPTPEQVAALAAREGA